MADGQTQKPRPTVSRDESAEIAARDAARQQDTEHGRREAKAAERQEHLDDIDDLLDEIDGLLEEQEVLTSYRQRGGE